jgi:hypothetical protein
LSVAGSYTRYESLPVRLAYLGLFAAPVWLIRDGRAREWVVPAFVFGTSVASLEAIAQWWLQVPFRPDGNLGNANLLGGLIAMAMPLALSQALRKDRFFMAWLVGMGVLVAGLVIVISRSGGLGAVAGCLALGVLALRGRAAAAAGLASLGIVAFGLGLIVYGPLRQLNNDPGATRFQLWPDGLHMIAARPITGWGLDTTGLALGRFLSGDWSPGVAFDRIHSGPLDLAATQGLLGLAALGCVLVVFFRGAWKARFTDSVASLTAACAGYTTWVLFNFDWAPTTGAFWLLAGTAWSGVRAAQTTTPGQPELGGVDWWRSAVAVILVAAATALAVLPALADVWYARGRSDLAVTFDPLQAQYHWTWGQTLVARGRLTGGVNELRRAADLGETERAMYIELGDLEMRLGRRSQARADYARALEIDPYYAPAQQRLAGG